ncbi:Serpentine receptor class gamma-14 [Caenorhabditis elegans]|uniref:Serpentine receptor class gamma-14 n=1 Tax=Caenorhabditis elegans TaxID=6239 RepID=SRG14_CAEEL|nr:Serpentine receptor class gamma-14 [Caenorhabditis elegans]P91275.1 RecName: Full=Serpentine receptor class gamma-14; Short=Protein srg-14 [Caenorhabditis elegans]CCD64198.1 Serpentine receptor class gamma-14 [Caenorhabditis elegans]|eukprot:NP_491823.1 Serpentine receptor class gamma-14 [Caenorhabditis elegans]
MSDFSPDMKNLDIDPIPVDCDLSYNTNIEVLKFTAQIIYIITGIFLNSAVLGTILWRCREVYSTNSFFTLFSVDCIANISILITEGLFARFFIYFTPICPVLADYFQSPLVGFKIIMLLTHHVSICKSLLQVLLVLNRMTCVLFPITHDSIWRKSLKYVISAVFLIPFCADWNIAISRVYMQSTYGGFWVSYFKKVSWASQSRFQLVFIIIALSFTFICTAITLLKLPERSKEIEKAISNATVIISIGFTFKVLFQIYYSFFFSYTDASSPVYGFSFLALDFLTVGSPIVMICVSRNLRTHIFKSKRKNQTLSKMLTRTSGMVIAR